MEAFDWKPIQLRAGRAAGARSRPAPVLQKRARRLRRDAARCVAAHRKGGQHGMLPPPP